MNITDIHIDNYDLIDLIESYDCVPELTWNDDIAYFSVDNNNYETTIIEPSIANYKTYKPFF